MQCNAMQCNAMQCNAMQCNKDLPAGQGGGIGWPPKHLFHGAPLGCQQGHMHRHSPWTGRGTSCHGGHCGSRGGRRHHHARRHWALLHLTLAWGRVGGRQAVRPLFVPAALPGVRRTLSPLVLLCWHARCSLWPVAPASRSSSCWISAGPAAENGALSPLPLPVPAVAAAAGGGPSAGRGASSAEAAPGACKCNLLWWLMVQ
jgi:hypothetical protein